MKGIKERWVNSINDFAIGKTKAEKMTAANALKAMKYHEETRASWVCMHQIDDTARTCGRL